MPLTEVVTGVLGGATAAVTALAAGTTGSSLPGLVVFLPLAAVWIWSLVDVLQSDSAVVRWLSKEQWLWIVVLTNVLGALLWLTVGRPRT